MKGYHNKVNSLAGPKEKTEVSLVVNLFQSVLDGFIRGEIKRVESEPVKVNIILSVDVRIYKLQDSVMNLTPVFSQNTKKKRKKDKCVS